MAISGSGDTSAPAPAISWDRDQERTVCLVKSQNATGFKLLHGTLSRCTLAFALSLAHVALAHATWVRGRGNVNNVGVLDNLVVAQLPNPPIPSVATVQFNDGQKGIFAQSDLGNGALRGRAFVSGGSGSAGVNPILGETITFNNTTGSESSWDFSYAIDGTVTTGANPIPIFRDFGGGQILRTTFITFAMHVFPAHTVGPFGSANQWTDHLDDAIFTMTKDIAGFPTSGDLQNFSAQLSDEISGSIPLPLGSSSFDVVTIFGAQGNIPSTTDSSFDFNFLNTAALNIESDVEFTSDSGLFLTGRNVPEPAAIALLGLGALGAIAGWRRPGTYSRAH